MYCVATVYIRHWKFMSSTISKLISINTELLDELYIADANHRRPMSEINVHLPALEPGYNWDLDGIATMSVSQRMNKYHQIQFMRQFNPRWVPWLSSCLQKMQKTKQKHTYQKPHISRKIGIIRFLTELGWCSELGGGGLLSYLV